MLCPLLLRVSLLSLPCAFLQSHSPQKGQVDHQALAKGLQSLLDTSMGSLVQSYTVILGK